MKMKYPKISIVTPSYNQVAYIEDTIRSVLEQDYPDLEYVIIDGGSTDGSVEIIKKYEKYLTHWESKEDEGQYNAINKGFRKTNGEIMAWLNADDKYCPWTFKVIAQVFSQIPEVNWASTVFPMTWDKDGVPVICVQMEGHNRELLVENKYFIQQESTFWRRSLWEKAGGYVDESYWLAADFELWNRFYNHDELYGIRVPLAGFRMHELQRTVNIKQYLAEVDRVIASNEWRSPGRTIRQFIKTLGLHNIRGMREMLLWGLLRKFFTRDFKDIIPDGNRGEYHWRVHMRKGIVP
jgi:glycosyltransferase involved in cell wall biosynthesis